MLDLSRRTTDLDLDVSWVHGARSQDPDDLAAAGPPIQVHSLDAHTYVLRQNKTVHFEGPFLYLLLGADRALLLDTGATADPAAFPLRDTVDTIVGRWLEDHPRPGYELVVAHSHAHGDHVAADAQFTDRPDTVIVGTTVQDVRSFFGFNTWPDAIVPFDLGSGRLLQVVGTPGTRIPPSPSTTPGRGSSSPVTPSTPDASTSSTSTPSPPASSVSCGSAPSTP